MADFDRVAEIYDSTRKEPDDVMRSTLEVMDRVLAGRRSILDVGVGTGRFAKPLSDMGLPVVGVDVSTSMMAKARAKGLHELIRGDARSLPFHDGSFDAAIAILVVHLMDEWERVVAEIGRVCHGLVISVVGRDEGPNIRRSYLELRRKAGFPLRKLNDDAQGLRKIVRPSKVYPIMERQKEIDADDSIRYFENRESSITWDLPESVHRGIIDGLRSLYGGRVLHQRVMDELAVWDSEQLRLIESTRGEP